MFAGFRSQVKNELTELLAKEPNLPMERLLQHTDLAMTARSENSAFIDYFKGTDEGTGKPRIRLLIEWALTLEHNSKENIERFRIYQLNRNASNIICYPSQSLKDLIMQDGYLFEVLMKWEEYPTSTEPIFAGHFARIIERVLLFDSEDLLEKKFDLRKLITFCISHVDILAYQGLLSHLALESNELFETVPAYGKGEGAKTKYFEDILREAARLAMTLESRVAHDKKRGNVDLRKSLTWTAKSNLRVVMHNPLSMDRKTVLPPPSYSRATEASLKLMKKQRDIPEFKERLAQRREAVGWVRNMHCQMPSEMVQARAYLLISAIQNGIIANSDILKLLQTREVAELILMVCVYCDDFSMVGPAAARLLKQLLYGYTEEESVRPLDADEFEQLKPSDPGLVYEPEMLVVGMLKENMHDIDSLILDYAPDMRFDFMVTPKMAALFAIFWNCRYHDLKGEVESKFPDMDIELEKPQSQPDSSPVFYHYQQPAGKTPLELYNHLLLDEPPMSDALCHDILRVIKFDHNMTSVLRDPGPDASPEEFYELQRAALKSDLGYMEFLRSKFLYAGREVDMSVTPDALALCPSDEFFRTAEQKYRVALNGHAMEFYLFNQDCQRFQFDNAAVSYLQTHVPVMRYEKSILDYERFQKDFKQKATVPKSCGSDEWRQHLTANPPQEPSEVQSPREI